MFLAIVALFSIVELLGLMRVFNQFLVFVVALAAFAASACASDRYALVIGNDTYAEVPKLELARADATAISQKLTAQGFQVTELLDGTRRETNRQISAFASQLEAGDTAFLFFAGHGVEIEGENYLLPIDVPAPASAERDFIKAESIALSSLLDQIRSTGARTTIAVIDACRDNPFATATGRSIGGTRGLGRIAAPEGMFVIFSAGAGQLALDRLDDSDTGANSVFTRKLLPLLDQPDLELRQLMSQLRGHVRDLALTANHDQVPAYYDELIGQFYFRPVTLVPAVELSQNTPESDDQTRQDFALARSVGTVEAFDAFLERYADKPDDFSVQLAVQMREQLTTSLRPQATENTETDAARGPQANSRASTPEIVPQEQSDAALAQKERSKREILVTTQQHLNALGCNAGIADGVIGRRTRAAFARFRAVSKEKLDAEDLGSLEALNAVTAIGAPKCPVVQNTPSLQATESAADTGSNTSTKPALSLAGTWSFKAKCALFIESHGTVRVRHVRDNFYTGTIRDNLGNVGNTEVYVNGRTITATEYYPGLVVHFRGRLAADGRSYTGTGSNTCSVYASKG